MKTDLLWTYRPYENKYHFFTSFDDEAEAIEFYNELRTWLFAAFDSEDEFPNYELNKYGDTNGVFDDAKGEFHMFKTRFNYPLDVTLHSNAQITAFRLTIAHYCTHAKDD